MPGGPAGRGSARRGQGASRVSGRCWRPPRAGASPRVPHALREHRCPPVRPVRVGGPCAPPGRGGGGGGDFIAVTREFLTGLVGAELGIPHLGAWVADRPGWTSGAGGGAAVSRAAGTISGRPFPGGSPPPGTPGKAARSSALRSRAGRAGGACAWNQPSRDPGPPGGPRSAGAGCLRLSFPGSSHCRFLGEGLATGQVPRLRLGGLEEACGPSQDWTVQKCLCPSPP